MLEEILNSYWFSQRETKVYLACLELGNAIASSIARHAWENRVTTYSILKELKTKWIINELQKNWVKYFSAISPKELIKQEEQKLEKLKSVLPELMAISNAYNNKTKVYYYEWIERLKDLFKEITDEWSNMSEPYLTFVWTLEMEKNMKKFLETEFVDYRMRQKNTTRAIVADNNSTYANYHTQNHDTLVISDPIFEMWNEIVLYWKNKIWILSYFSKEIYWLVIESEVLYKWLKWMFNIIRKAYKK